MKEIISKKRPSSDSGFSLVEIVFVLGLMAFVYTLYIQSQAEDTEQYQAREIGIKLHEYQTAVRRFATINASNEDIIDNDITEVGSHWLKAASTCSVPSNLDSATGSIGLIDCNFPDNAINGLNNTAFSSTVTKEDENSPLIVKTVIDMTTNDADGNRTSILSDSSLSLGAITATGGSFSTALSIAGQKVTSVEPYMSASTNRIIYCQIGFEESMLNP
jgi:type II secretory pathway pseudopilin PulG